MATVELTTENFERTVEDNDIVLVDFWAEWCGPCHLFAPVYETSSEENADIVHGKLDTEAAAEIAAAAQITAIPTLMAFRDGMLVFRQSGALPAAALKEVVASVRGLDMDEIRAQMAADRSADEPGS